MAVLSIDTIHSEFLKESQQALARFKDQIASVRMNPADSALLTRLIRTICSIKENCKFLGFSNLESISQAEELLGEVRASRQPVTPELISIVVRATATLQSKLFSF